MDGGDVDVVGLQYVLRYSAHVTRSNRQGCFWYPLLHKTRETEAWRVGCVASSCCSGICPLPPQPRSHWQAGLSPSLGAAAQAGAWRRKVGASYVTARCKSGAF